jgi:hypothetical protein
MTISSSAYTARWECKRCRLPCLTNDQDPLDDKPHEQRKRILIVPSATSSPRSPILKVPPGTCPHSPHITSCRVRRVATTQTGIIFSLSLATAGTSIVKRKPNSPSKPQPHAGYLLSVNSQPHLQHPSYQRSATLSTYQLTNQLSEACRTARLTLSSLALFFFSSILCLLPLSPFDSRDYPRPRLDYFSSTINY